MKKHETTAAFVFGTLGMVPFKFNPISTPYTVGILLGPISPWPRGANFRVGYQSHQTFVPQNLSQRFLSEQRLGMMSILHL